MLARLFRNLQNIPTQRPQAAAARVFPEKARLSEAAYRRSFAQECAIPHGKDQSNHP